MARCKYCPETATRWFNLAEEVPWGDEVIEGLGTCDTHADAFRETYQHIIISDDAYPVSLYEVLQEHGKENDGTMT